MKSLFTTENEHNPKIIDKLNSILHKTDPSWILMEMQCYFDDAELGGFADHLESRIPKDYVIEYNVRSMCGQKAYSAVAIPVEAFGQMTFNEMISHKNFKEYYLEQDLEGKRSNGQDVLYDRAWVRSSDDPENFIKYLENRL
jgi:hypothetical protein